MRDKSQRTATKNESKYFVAVTKHRSNADMNGEWDFQIQQAYEKWKKKKKKEIQTNKIYFMFYIFTIHSTITNKK